MALGAADVYIGPGYPYGPVFASAVVALFSAVQAGYRTSVVAGNARGRSLYQGTA